MLSNFSFLLSVVETTILLSDINDYKAVNEVYATCKNFIIIILFYCVSTSNHIREIHQANLHSFCFVFMHFWINFFQSLIPHFLPELLSNVPTYQRWLTWLLFNTWLGSAAAVCSWNKILDLFIFINFHWHRPSSCFCVIIIVFIVWQSWDQNACHSWWSIQG